MSTYPVKGYQKVDLKLEAEYKDWSPGGGIKTWRGFLSWKQRCIDHERERNDCQLRLRMVEVEQKTSVIECSSSRLASVLAQMKKGVVTYVLPNEPTQDNSTMDKLLSNQVDEGIVCDSCHLRQSVNQFSLQERKRGVFAVCLQCVMLSVVVQVVSEPPPLENVLVELIEPIVEECYTPQNSEIPSVDWFPLVEKEDVVSQPLSFGNVEITCKVATPLKLIQSGMLTNSLEYQRSYGYQVQEKTFISQLSVPLGDESAHACMWSKLQFRLRTSPITMNELIPYRVIVVQSFVPREVLLDRPHGLFWTNPKDNSVECLRRSPNWNILADYGWNLRGEYDKDVFMSTNQLVLNIDIEDLWTKMPWDMGRVYLLISSSYDRDLAHLDIDFDVAYNLSENVATLDEIEPQYGDGFNTYPKPLQFEQMPMLDWGAYLPDRYLVDGIYLTYDVAYMEARNCVKCYILVCVAYGDKDEVMSMLADFGDQDFDPHDYSTDTLKILGLVEVEIDNAYVINLPLKFLGDRLGYRHAMFYFKAECAVPLPVQLTYAYRWHRVGTPW